MVIMPNEYNIAIKMIFGAVVERMLLVERAIENEKLQLSSSGLIPVVETIAAVLRETQQCAWTEIQAIYQRNCQPSVKHSEEGFKNALAILSDAAVQTIRLHQYMGLLPTSEAPRALAKVLEMGFSKITNEIKPVVALLPDLDCYEFDLVEVITRDSIFSNLDIPERFHEKIIRFSGVDALSPLSWPILGHEFGHAISQVKSLEQNLNITKNGRTIFDGDSLGSALKSFHSEFLADAIALCAFGPSVLLALMRFELFLLSLSGMKPKSTKTHPSVHSRIEFMIKLLGQDVMSPFQQSLANYQSIREILLDEDDFIVERTFEQEWFPLLQEDIERKTLNMTNMHFSKDDLLQAERLANRLCRGVPPSSVRTLTKAKARPELLRAIKEKNFKSFKGLMGNAREVPATPGQVLTAAYLHREQLWMDRLEHTLMNCDLSKPWSEWTQELRVFLEKNDELLRSSLSSVEIHMELIAHSQKELGDPIAGDALVEFEDEISPTADSLLGDTGIMLRLLDERDDHRLYVTPLIDPKTQINPASLDVRLGTDALLITNVNLDCLDPIRNIETCRRELAAYTRRYRISRTVPLVLHPGEFALAASLEYIKMPPDLLGKLDGRSSYGRAGLVIHATAALINPGYAGHVTFELKNTGKIPIKLYAGIRVAQIMFFSCTQSLLQYGAKKENKYNQALEALASRLFEDVEYEWYRKFQD